MMTSEEALRHLGEPVTGPLRDYAEATSRGYLWKSKLSRRHERTYRCSLCGAEWISGDGEEPDIYQDAAFSGNLKHWDRATCPNCERGLFVYEEWRGIGKIGLNEHFVEQWRKSAIDPNVIVAVGATVTRQYDEPGEVDRYPRIQVVSFVVYRYGRAGERFVLNDKHFGRMTKVNHLDAGLYWLHREGNKEIDEESVNEAVKGTPYERVWIDKLLRVGGQGEYLNSPVLKMSWLSTHPVVEYMIKLGFEKLVCERFMLLYRDNVINWRGKKIEDVFKMDKATVRALRPYGMRMGYDELESFGMFRAAGVTWPAPKLMNTIFGLHLQPHNARGLLDEIKRRGYSARLELKYLMKQANISVYQRVHDLVDYWRQCDRLEVPRDDYRTRHPADLDDMHARNTARIRYQSDKKYDEGIQGRLEELTKALAWTGCGLILRPAKDTREVIYEGTVLHHCVGGYCQAYALGKTVILVLRREEKPDKPFHTVEMTPEGVLIQCRGDHNRTADEDKELIDRFWDEYQKAMGKGQRRKAA